MGMVNFDYCVLTIDYLLLVATARNTATVVVDLVMIIASRGFLYTTYYIAMTGEIEPRKR